MVYGRIAGETAADYAKKKFKDGKLSLSHVDKYHQELEKSGVKVDGRVAPMILPDYSNPDVRKKQLTSSYIGTIR
jgi:succinate dehydrogenase/fumarate reductase flavoprotein subunit